MSIPAVEKFEAGPASGRVTPRSVQLEEPEDIGRDGSATPDGPAVLREASLHGYEAVAANIVGSYEPARLLKAQRKSNYEKNRAAHSCREDQQRYIHVQEMAVKAQQDFDEPFTCDEWKLIAARVYWSSAAAHVEDHGTHI